MLTVLGKPRRRTADGKFRIEQPEIEVAVNVRAAPVK
jgi:hypothetical protein